MIAEAVRKRRQELGLLQVEVAAMVGTSQQSVARLEAGRLAECLPEVLDALGLTLSVPDAGPPPSGLPSPKRFKKAAALTWGETPFDGLSREELLRLVQAYHSALGSTSGALKMVRSADPTSRYWGEDGTGGRALAKAAVPVDGYIVTIKCEKIEDACPLCMGSGIMGRPHHPRRCRVCEGARKAPA